MPIWFRVNGGNWNANPSANPSTNTGGESLAAVAGVPLFAAVLVNAGATNDNATANFGATAFANAAPSGFPAYGAGVTLDPATVVDGALSGGNLTITETGLSTGGALATTSIAPGGRAYFEVTLNSINAFTAHVTGCGVGIASVPATYNDLATGSGAGAGQGGASIGFTGPNQNAEVGVNGSIAIANMGVVSPGAVIGIAFIVEGAGVEPILDVADLFFTNTPAFVDLSQEANRRLFIDVNGCPMYLGVNGQLPFNQAPAVFLTCTAETPATFANNAGLGGTFTITGGDLSLASKQPCCSEVVTAQTIPVGADPQVILSVSDDGGRTWSLLRKSRSIGRLGQYLTRIRWLKMGQFRQRVIRLEITDPVKRRIVGFYVDVRQGLP